jgi:hypothetical protein
MNACIIDGPTGDVLSQETLERRIAERGYAHAMNDTIACYWVEHNLCSACVGMGRPTDAEAPPLYFTGERVKFEPQVVALLVVALVVPGLLLLAWIGGGR